MNPAAPNVFPHRLSTPVACRSPPNNGTTGSEVVRSDDPEHTPRSLFPEWGNADNYVQSAEGFLDGSPVPPRGIQPTRG
jgi:hypothetical protein